MRGYFCVCGCGGRIWTYDLRVMSPTSYQLLHSAISLWFSPVWWQWLVPETGVEPVRDYSHGILSPGRLPIPPLRHTGPKNREKAARWQAMPVAVANSLAPREGLEPSTYRLTAECSAIELPWNDWCHRFGTILIIHQLLWTCQPIIWDAWFFSVPVPVLSWLFVILCQSQLWFQPKAHPQHRIGCPWAITLEKFSAFTLITSFLIFIIVFDLILF